MTGHNSLTTFTTFPYDPLLNNIDYHIIENYAIAILLYWKMVSYLFYLFRLKNGFSFKDLHILLMLILILLMLILSIGLFCNVLFCNVNNSFFPNLLAAQNRLLKDELEQLRARSASDARLQQKLQQDLINLEKVRTRPFAINSHMVQNLPYWRAGLLLVLHWKIQTKGKSKVALRRKLSHFLASSMIFS